MLIQRTGDIIAQRDAPVVANPVNCVGVMGKGLALSMSKAFPETVAEYKRLCRQGLLIPGKPALVKTNRRLPSAVLMFPTKDHWRDPSRLEWIEDGLVAMHALLRRHNLNAVALPMLGAGLGGLGPDDVLKAIEKSADANPETTIHLFERR